MKRCAGLIILNSQGEYLLQMRDDTPGIASPLCWDFFGGGIEEGEDARQAAAREMLEEIGVEALSDELALDFSGMVNDVEEHLFRLSRTVEWGDFKVFEGAGAGFFTPAEIAKLPCSAPVGAYFASR
jgi:8-oxo-dGTP pyrophosphatase MutT (NUDIX family)